MLFRSLNTYAGLTVPLIASATATFLFRQFFMTVPDELAEAARVDGAGPMRFFRDVLLPLSKTTMAALFVIQFIYGWNQYLWPLLVTTEIYTIAYTLSLHDALPIYLRGADHPAHRLGHRYVPVPPVLHDRARRARRGGARRRRGADALLPRRAAAALQDQDRKSTRLNSSHIQKSRMPSSA